MKKLLIICAVIFTATTTFAQKAKNKAANTNQTETSVTYSCPMHPEVKMDKDGNCPKCGMSLTASKKEQLKQKVTQSYKCPMHNEVVSDTAGTCSKCGMNLKASKKEQLKMKAMNGYSCPMHADETSKTAGKCGKCGMALTKKG
jgi:transcription initiation factor IIE alpha subunit